MKIRPIRIEGDLAYVPLTKGYEAVIDAADAEFVGRWNWCAFVQKNGRIYAARGEKHKGKCKLILMHRVLMNTPEGYDTDHADMNGLNNKRTNLRVASRSENMRNSRRRKASATGLKGVGIHSQSGKFRARLMVDYKDRHLGLYDTAEEAYEAYCAAAPKHHGEFARTN